MTNIISVSVSEEHKNLIKERNLSPSAVLRTALDRISKQIGPGDAQNEQMWLEKLQRLVTTVQQYNLFLEKKGLLKDFNNSLVEKDEEE